MTPEKWRFNVLRNILLAAANAIHMCKEGNSRSHWSRRFIYHSPLVAAACDCCQRWRTLFLGLLVGITTTFWLMRNSYSFGYFDIILFSAWGFFLGGAIFNWAQLGYYVANRKTYLVDSRLAESTKKDDK